MSIFSLASDELLEKKREAGPSTKYCTTWKESFSTVKLKEGRKMKKRFSEEQIVKMIQEHKQGKSI